MDETSQKKITVETSQKRLYVDETSQKKITIETSQKRLQLSHHRKDYS